MTADCFYFPTIVTHEITGLESLPRNQCHNKPMVIAAISNQWVIGYRSVCYEGITDGYRISTGPQLSSHSHFPEHSGSYTAIVRGFDNVTGNALVEVYGIN
jgi:hypothetical protein